MGKKQHWAPRFLLLSFESIYNFGGKAGAHPKLQLQRLAESLGTQCWGSLMGAALCLALEVPLHHRNYLACPNVLFFEDVEKESRPIPAPASVSLMAP